jgi:hypothetical protein
MPSSLPVEIWISILETATDRAANALIPELDTSPPPALSLDVKLWEPWAVDTTSLTDPFREYQRAQNDRYYFALVSKTWNQIITPALYTSLFLVTSESVYFFFRTPIQDKRQCNERLRFFTKHLHIELHNEEVRQWSPLELRLISAACQRLSHLEALVVVPPPSGSQEPVWIDNASKAAPIIHELANGRNLRRLECVCTPSDFKATQLSGTLEVLTLMGTMPRDGAALVHNLPALHTLNLLQMDDDFLLQSISGWSLPSLRRVAILVNPRMLQAGFSGSQFFEEHGKSLTFVHIIQWHNLSVINLLSQCPKLQTIILSCSAMRYQRMSHPTLKWIGLSIDDELVGATTRLNCSIFAIMNIHHGHKILEHVHLVDFEINNFRTHTFSEEGDLRLWRNWIGLYRDIGIHFEFWNGDLVEIPANVKLL